jgi:hypothetical protein
MKPGKGRTSRYSYTIRYLPESPFVLYEGIILLYLHDSDEFFAIEMKEC